MDNQHYVLGKRVDHEHVQRARDLRRTATPEERMLWQRLRHNQLVGLHFRQQQIIAGFIVDFYCHAARLVIELDGGVHDEQVEYDRERDEVLIARGLKILRIPNNEIHRDLNGVLAQIAAIALQRQRERGPDLTPSPPSL
jgi:very-short-patch-repair endonuclease